MRQSMIVPSIFLFGVPTFLLLDTYYLDFASVEFTKDTRQQVRSCSALPQALDNDVDLAKSALPKGKQSWIFVVSSIGTQQAISDIYIKSTWVYEIMFFY